MPTRSNLLEHALTKALSRLDDLADIKKGMGEIKTVCNKTEEEVLDLRDRMDSIELSVNKLETWKKRAITWLIAGGLGASGGSMHERVQEFLLRKEGVEVEDILRKKADEFEE